MLARIDRRVSEGDRALNQPDRVRLAKAADAFHVVCPSLPGFGFSAKPQTAGWGVDRIAQAWASLMDRLGYQRYARRAVIGARRSRHRSARWTAHTAPAFTSRSRWR